MHTYKVLIEKRLEKLSQLKLPDYKYDYTLQLSESIVLPVGSIIKLEGERGLNVWFHYDNIRGSIESSVVRNLVNSGVLEFVDLDPSTTSSYFS